MMRHDMIRPEAKALLFLQGPHGPFFRRLGDALADAGHRVYRINLNGGDRLDWGPGGIDYRGTGDDWPLFLDAFLRDHGITDVILYGDCRAVHRAAHGIAKLRGCRIHVFEEGYIRPDFLTLEREGVNGNSTLSDDPDWYLAEAARLPPAPVFDGVPASFQRRARQTIAYNVATVTGRLRFPFYRSHRPSGAWYEAIGWIGRRVFSKGDRRQSEEAMRAIGDRPYFCLPMQLSSDHQIRTHSPFEDMTVAIAFVIRSFAAHAPADTLLVLKRHPLDADLVPYGRIIAREAERNGVGDRVFYLPEGDVTTLVERARGVVTVNSTTGTLALRKGIPTAVLGDAVYHMPRITYQGTLDAFWCNPVAPDMAVYDAFCRVLIDRCLVHGGYLSEEGLDVLVRGAMARLDGDIALRHDFCGTMIPSR